MKSKFFALIVFSSIILLPKFVQAQDENLFDINNIKANLEFLASDELEGREATTRGARIASLYIAMQLQKYGIKPFGDNGTYFQNFKMSITGYDTASTIQITDPVKEIINQFAYATDFGRGGRGSAASGNLIFTSGLVFAGYGISAPEFEYDDYKDLDVAGKTVLLLSGEPYSEDSTFFDGEDDTRYSRGSYKIENAKNKGAVAVLYLPSERSIQYWRFFMMWSKSLSFSLPDTSEEESNAESIPAFLLSESMAESIFSSEEKSYQDIKSLVEQNEIPFAFYLNKDIKFNVISIGEIKDARNVVGIIEGNDPVLKNEYVSFGAHYDHEGIHNGVVYNGADDDGSGTVAILETAKAFALSKQNKRSVVVFFHTGEEKGLLGSSYSANHISYINNIVANINIDMVGRESIDSIYCIGSDKLSTELHNIVEDANKETVNFYLDYSFDDPNDPQRLYYRSDHINYARKGIPIVFFYDYMMQDYHKPTDDVDKINFEKILKTVKLVYNIGLEIANLDHRLVVDKKEEMTRN